MLLNCEGGISSTAWRGFLRGEIDWGTIGGLLFTAIPSVLGLGFSFLIKAGVVDFLGILTLGWPYVAK